MAIILDPAGKMLRARVQLQNKAYFIYHTLFTTKYRIAPPEEAALWAHPTAYADTLGNIVVSEEFIKDKSNEYVEMLLAHEAMHLVLLHPVLAQGRIRLLFNIACFPPDVLVGHKAISEISTGDIVYDKDGQRVSVTAIHTRAHTGHMINIRPHNMLPIMATPEHPFWVRSRKYMTHHPITLETANSWRKADELRVNQDYLVIPKIVPDCHDTALDLQPFIDHTAKHAKLQSIPLNEDIAWLLGLYVAEGSDSAKNQSMCFSLSGQEIDLVRKIRQINDTYLGYSLRTYQQGPTRLKVVLPSAILARALKHWCGSGAHNKHIPDFILRHSNRGILKAFLRGVVDGDGHIDQYGYIRIGISSRILAEQLQMAYCSAYGILGSLGMRLQRPRTINGRELPRHPLYTLVVCAHHDTVKTMRGRSIVSHNRRWRDMGDYILTPIVGIDRKHYEGQVYNLETSSHSYVAGNVSVHNCDIKANQFVKEWGYRNLPSEFVQTDYRNSFSLKDPSGNVVASVEDCHIKHTLQIYDELYEQLKNNNMIKTCGVFGDGKGGVPPTSPTGDPQDSQGGNSTKEKMGNDGLPDDASNHSGWDVMPQGEDKTSVYDKLVDRIRDAYTSSMARKNKGDMPAGLERILEEILAGKIDWRNKLKKFVYHSLPKDVSWSLPHKKSYATGAYLPHVVKEGVDVIVSIDTSGSISQEELSRFLGEMIHMAQQCNNINMTVIVCDAEVHGVFPVRNGRYKDIMDIQIKGGGGTDHRPVYEFIKNYKGNAKLLINFTDGFTTFPDRPSDRVETLWVLTPNSISPDNIPFGYIVRMEE